MSKASNDFILIPEIAIEKMLSTSLRVIRDDFEDSDDEKETLLYFLTKDVNIQRVNVFNEAKKIFLITNDNDPKRITINLGYPKIVTSSVNLSIIQSAEQYAMNALSVDQSSDYFDEYISDNVRYRNTYGRRYSATYQIIITGDNTNEVLITYNIFKSLLISFDGTSHLNALGFENVKITGQDMNLKSDIFPNKYAKNLTFSFEYEFRVPDINRSKYWNNIIFKGIIID